MDPRLYILVRADLSPAQQAVQAGHAVAEFVKLEMLSGNMEMGGRPNWVYWHNQTLIYLVVPNEIVLDNCRNTLHYKDMIAICWHEPDLNNELTAIACCTDKNIFDKLPMLGQ